MLGRKRKGRGLNQSPNVQNENDLFRVRTPGDALLQRSDRKLPDYLNVADDLVSIGAPLSNGVIECDFPTGDYVYRGLALMIEGKATTAISGVTAPNLMTTGDDQREYVKEQYFSNLISRVTLEADGIEVWDFESYRELEQYIRLFGWDANSSYWSFVGFGWPNVFRDGSPAEALYALGTQNIRDLRLKVQTTDLWKSEMKLRMPVWYAPVRQPATQVISRQTWTRSLATAGRHVIDDVRIDKRIWRLIITTTSGKQVSDYRVEIGDIEWQSGRADVNKIEAVTLAPPWGSQVASGAFRSQTGALSAVGSVIDLRVDMDREGLAIAPLTSQAQRRRDDRLKIEITTLKANTEVTIRALFADRI